MLVLDHHGLYCEAGNFYIDPKGSVENAVVTHAHSDHARRGAKQYYAAASGVSLLRCRLGQKIPVQGIPFGEPFFLGPVKVSFHPAGHILGSSQVRLEHKGEVWVASGDYKRDPDPTCEPFESVPCDVFVTEATFGTPAYQWNKEADLGQDIFSWWKKNASEGFNSLIFAYSLGKTQRVLGELAFLTDRPVHCVPAASPLIQCYRDAGVRLAPTICLGALEPSTRLEGELILAPQSFLQSSLAEILGDRYRTAFASGWMAQGHHNYDHGFLMSDHADWNDLLRTIEESRARTVYVQHRGNGALVKHLKGLGLKAFPEEKLARPEKPRPQQMSLFA
jgi:putative mRNA 3-end processing factor